MRFRDIKKIDLVKIDVEGAEMLVLEGAANVLNGKNAPDLIVEVIDNQLRRDGSSEEELLNYLNGFGYRPYSFTKDGLRSYHGKGEGLNLYFKHN